MKKSVIILSLIGFLLVIVLTGQNNNPNAKPAIASEVEALLDSSDIYQHRYLDSAIEFALSARELASKHNYTEGEVLGLTKAALDLTFRGEPVKMQEIYNQAIFTGRDLDDKTPLVYTYFKIGDSYRSLYHFDKSYYYYQLGVDLIFANQLHQNEKNMAYLYQHLGYMLFYELKDSSVSIDYLKKAKNLYKSINQYPDYLDMFINIGESFRLNHDFANAKLYFDSCKTLLSANYHILTDAMYFKSMAALYLDNGNMAVGISYLNESIDLFKKAGDKKQLGDVYTMMAYAYSSFGDFDKCIKYNHLARESRASLGAITVLTSSMANLSGNYYQIGDYNKALNYADSALSYAKQCDHRYYIERGAMQFYRIFKKIGNDKKALQFLELADSIKNVLTKEKNPSFQLIESKIKLQNKERLEQNKQQIERTEQHLEYSLYISLLLMMIIAVFVLWIFKLKKTLIDT